VFAGVGTFLLGEILLTDCTSPDLCDCQCNTVHDWSIHGCNEKRKSLCVIVG
jgi:hypothetical protein